MIKSFRLFPKITHVIEEFSLQAGYLESVDGAKLNYSRNEDDAVIVQIGQRGRSVLNGWAIDEELTSIVKDVHRDLLRVLEGGHRDLSMLVLSFTESGYCLLGDNADGDDGDDLVLQCDSLDELVAQIKQL